MKIYLAGPMRGYADFNRPSFEAATARLRGEGHEVFSPVENTVSIYGPSVYIDQPEGDEARTVINPRIVFSEDLRYICREADAVALLPGWENSRGARAEKATAVALDLQIIYL